MYNGFGAYPADDMDMGVNSYFGESDTNFFGDTSNDSFFGEGAGFTFDSSDSFFSESDDLCSDGSELFTETLRTGWEYNAMSSARKAYDKLEDDQHRRLRGSHDPADRKHAEKMDALKSARKTRNDGSREAARYEEALGQSVKSQAERIKHGATEYKGPGTKTYRSNFYRTDNGTDDGKPRWEYPDD